MDTRRPAPTQPPQQPPGEPRSPFDLALAAALRDVPAPNGLKDRLLLAVSQARSALPAGSVQPLGKAIPSRHIQPPSAATREEVQAKPDHVDAGIPDAHIPEAGIPEPGHLEPRHIQYGHLEPCHVEAGRDPRQGRRGRRWLTVALVAAVALALMCWFLVPHMWSAAKPTPDELLVLAREHMPQDLAAKAGWKDIDTGPPRDYPMAFQHVRKQRVARWRSCRLGAAEGVLFDVSQPGVKGALYVVPLEEVSVAGQALPPSPGRPVFTQGRTSCIWRESQYLCLLIVEGDEQALRRLLKQPSPVAYRRPHVRTLAASSTASHEQRSLMSSGRS